MYSWGNNNHGQLGLTSDGNVNAPKFVKNGVMEIVKISTSNKHTAIVGNNGYLYTAGCNDDGERGIHTSVCIVFHEKLLFCFVICFSKFVDDNIIFPVIP